MRITRIIFTDREKNNTIIYKVETYLDCLLVPKIYAIPNFMKIVRAVLKIHESCFHTQTGRQTDNPICNKVETYLDHLLMTEIQVIPNFVKIIRTILEIYESCVYGQTDRQPDFLHGSDRAVA